MNIFCDATTNTFLHGNFTYFVLLMAGLVVIFILVGFIIQQKKTREIMERELAHLASIEGKDVEYELIIQAMKLATWHIDLETMEIVFDNDYREEQGLFSPKPDTRMMQVYEIVHPDDREKIKTQIKDLIEGRTDLVNAQFRMMQTNDKYYWEEIYCTVAERDDEGKPAVIVGTSMCIEDRKKKERELINARKHAEESDRLKSAFISNISHEVRTPLNAIIGFTDIMPMVTDEQERANLMSIVKENNSKLLRIFEHMMNISKIEAKDENQNLNIEKFNLVALMEQCVAKCSNNNTNPNIDIEFISKETSMEVNTDRERVEYIVRHFVENAMKFTTQGSITAGLSVTSSNRLRLWVTDTGIGIDKEHHDLIFERFYKVDSFVQGAGLGLAVCRSFALSLGGDVDFESEPGKGSSFWLEIPNDVTKAN
ncbi:MAG: ATP-binding protein [Prevotella sp.]|nr:ATP-binding protein [Prevotella sp.]